MLSAYLLPALFWGDAHRVDRVDNDASCRMIYVCAWQALPLKQSVFSISVGYVRVATSTITQGDDIST